MNELIIIKTTVKNKVTKNNIVNELIKNDYVSCINVILRFSCSIGRCSCLTGRFSEFSTFGK